jgi:RimJ/RimL family protein N-acetyltransferase
MQQEFVEEPNRLVPLRRGDMRAIMQWRNDQIDFLRQDRPLTDEDQERYWDKVRAGFKEYNPEEILFSLLQDDKCIGYGGLTRINWGASHGEVSFLLETDNSDYEENFTFFLKQLKVVAFNNLRFHRIYTETYAIRPEHVAILEKQGFFLEGRMREHARVQGKWVDALIHGCLNVLEE